MDIIKNIKYDKKYTSNLPNNEWTQNIKNRLDNNTDNNTDNKLESISNKTYKYIDDFIYNEFNFLSILNMDTMDTEIMKIAGNIDEDTDKYYNIYKYGRNFSKQLIQRGLQEKNNLSTLLYMGDLYNITFVIYDIENNNKIVLNDKNNKREVIIYNNNRFSSGIFDDVNDLQYDYENIQNMKKILNSNVTTLEIYKNDLKAISNYKSGDLIKLAEENNINLKDKDNKNKNKKQLYYEINRKLRNI